MMSSRAQRSGVEGPLSLPNTGRRRHPSRRYYRRPMKDIASWALETAKLRGASLAEARIVDDRHRSLATKNGHIGSASDSESLGVGIRVIADGAFGFAATDDLSREGVQTCAANAVQIAKASATVKAQELRMAAEPPAKADWAS